MKFEYNLSGIGWAKGRLEINDQVLNFVVSYLCDPLTDLLEGLVEITPGYGEREEVMEFTDNKYTFTWQGEPWGYEWILDFASFDRLHFTILFIEDFFEKDFKKKVVFESTCNYYDFVNAVIVELGRLLKKHGLVGYYDTWSGRRNFPIAEYFKLKYILQEKKPLRATILDSTNPKDQASYTKATLLEEEFELLIK